MATPPIPEPMKTNCACTEEKKTIQLAYDIWDVKDETKISWFWDPPESPKTKGLSRLSRTARFQATKTDGGILYFDSKEIPYDTWNQLGKATMKVVPPKPKKDTFGSVVVTMSRPNEQLSIQTYFNVTVTPM